MTKLKQKLQELGYEYDTYTSSIYSKYIEGHYFLEIILTPDNENIRRKLIFFGSYEMDLEIIEKLTKEMQKDLEVLREYET